MASSPARRGGLTLLRWFGYWRQEWRWPVCATDLPRRLSRSFTAAIVDGGTGGTVKKAKRLNAKVIALLNTGKYRDALPLAEEALKIRREILGKQHPDYASSLNNLAELYKSMGENAKAEPLYVQARDVYKKFAVINIPTTQIS